MDLESAIQISASGLKANRAWINVLSANLANMNTTKTADGVPYTRKTVIYEAVPAEWFCRRVELRDGRGGGKSAGSRYCPGPAGFQTSL